MRRAQRLARRGKLLGLAPLGHGQAGGVAGPDQFGDPPYYLINDTFTTDRAAGAVNGTDAEPGPGQRFVTDSGSKLSLASGSVSFATGGVNGDPRLFYNPVDRRPGLVLKGVTLHTSQGANWGVSAAPNTLVAEGIRVNATSLSVRANNISLAVGSIAISTTYQLALVIREGGALHFIKGGAFTNWTLLWVSSVSTGAALYPTIEAIGTSSGLTSSYFFISPERWLPSPLASDGFSAWGTADGLGHAEGVAGGLGSGGGALVMTAYVGAWGASGGVAQCSALTSGVGLAGRDVGTADVVVTVKVTRSGGVAGLFARENADDRVMAVHNGTNAQLIKRVAGVETTLVDTAATYVAGAEIRLICQGTAFRLFYNNVAIGSEQTISDASLQAETLAGIYTTNTSNAFDDLVVRARGTGGEYAALDAWVSYVNPWTGATWAVSGGNASNTPTLGSELLVDGGLENWTSSSNATNWAESIAGASSVAQETGLQRTGSSAAKLVIDSGNAFAALSQSITTINGNWYHFAAYARGLTGTPQARLQFASLSIVTSDRTLSTSYQEMVATGRASSTTVSFTISRLSAASNSLIYDDASARSLITANLLATIAGTSSTQTAAAKVVALTTGTQAGVVSLLDSASSPANFLIAYHDGTNVKLEKCVGGTYTQLISTAVAFSAGAQIEIRRPSGNTIQLWYNGSQRGVDQTVSDAGIISNTRYGLFSTYSGNTFSEFSLGGSVVPFDFPGV